MMLLQNPSFRDLDAFFDQVPGRSRASRPMPMDAYRRGDDVWVHIDLPGVSEDSLDVTVERNVLTVEAERNWSRQADDHGYLNERHFGKYRRQVTLGEGLDSERIEADYHDGVLTLRIPVAPQAKPRKIELAPQRLAINTIDAGTIDAQSVDADTNA